ncbi:MAG: ATP-binding protein [Maricaulaceae bacterium]
MRLAVLLSLMLAVLLTPALAWAQSEIGAAAVEPSARLDAAIAAIPELDLTDRSTQSRGILSLERGWAVWRGIAARPDTLADLDTIGIERQIVALPDIWGPRLTDRLQTGHGFATYALTVSGLDPDAPLGVDVGWVRTLARLVVIHRPEPGAALRATRIFQNADPTNLSQADARWAFHGAYPLPPHDGTVTLVLQVSNHVHKQGGVFEAPQIGPIAALTAIDRREFALNAISSVLLAAVGLASALIAIGAKPRLRYWVFGGLCLMAALQVTLSNNVFWDFTDALPVSRAYDFEYIGLILIVALYWAFVRIATKTTPSVWIDGIIYGVYGGTVFFLMFLAPNYAPGAVSLTREPFQIFAGVIITYTVALAAMTAVRADRMDPVFIGAAGVVFSAALYEILGALHLIHRGPNTAALVTVAVALIYAGNLVARMRALDKERNALTESLRQRTAALETASQQATKASQVKSDFLAAMSHEIRTPMNGVLGMLDLLRSGPLEPDQRRYADIAGQSATGLLRIIDDILDYSKLEAGRVDLEDIAFEPRAIVDGVVNVFGPKAREKGLALKIDIAPQTPQWLRGDPTRIGQILYNLVSNAIKFTDTGAVSVRIRPIANTERLHVSVSDTGVGVPTDAQDRLFTRFTQADSSTTRKYGGTGLGLVICKDLAELMDGRIGLKSAPGQGSTFWFEIPLREADAPQTEPNDAALEAGQLDGVRVLVAEDNPVNMMIVRTVLQKAGCHVIEAHNGQDAVAAVQTHPADVVLMDVQMPEMDGPTAAKAIRALPHPCAHVPIIALTAHAMKGDRESFLEAGMDEYLTKPLNPIALLSLIAKLAKLDAYNTSPKQRLG